MKVFLSSTYKDLVEHRKAAVEALERLGQHTGRMEVFGARPYKPLIACLAEIDECDLFVGIYAHRYGHVPDGEAVSITEAELNHATKGRKPIFCFVIDEDHPWPPKMIEEGEGKEKLQAIKRKVGSLVVREMFTTPEDLAAKVATSVGCYLSQKTVQIDDSGAVKTATICAHLLQTVEETHRRELAEAEAPTDWKERERLRKGAETAHATRLSRIEDIAASIEEIMRSGTGTSVFREMDRILREQGVDEAIVYVDTQRGSILQTVHDRSGAASERNRADLQPLLRTAALHQTKGQPAAARGLYIDILAAEPDWPEALHADFLFLLDQGDVARIRTTLAQARRDYEEAHRLAQRLIAIDPRNTQWQRDLSVSYNKLGDVAVAQGKLDDAAKAYGNDLAITKKLADADPSNTLWQRDLSVSYNKLGDVAVAQGKLEDAARDYGDGLAIRKKLADADPSNSEWQRDLSVSYNKLGNVAKAQGKLEDAARDYGDGLAIRKKLADADPSNSEWQRDLSVSYNKLGNVAKAQGKLEDAAKAYGNALTIAKKLEDADPSNTEWQRDLSISYNNLGDVAKAQGKLADAARAYGDSLAIAKKLAADDPSNTEWQRDLAFSYDTLANVAERQKKADEAHGYWKQALSVLTGIEKRGLHLSPEDRQWLESLRGKVSR